MTQDCSCSLFAADASTRLPKGIHIVGTDGKSGPKVEGVGSSNPPKHPASKQDPSTLPTSWSYLFLQHLAAKTLHRWLKEYNERELTQPYFVHQSYRYTYRNQETERGVKRVLEPSVSGLVFLQGTVKGLQSFLREFFPQYHLVNDCSTGKPASIRDSVMRPFMNVMQAHPEQVTFLHEPFEKLARDRARLRVLTGPFTGFEGYIVRIDRDRQLVFDFGGYAVALRGVHKEDFEVVTE
mgnify:CR=1 FL=1